MYQEHYKMSDWKFIVSSLLDNVNDIYYSELLESIPSEYLEDERFLINLGKLIQLNGNPLKIKSVEDINKYDEILMKEQSLVDLSNEQLAKVAFQNFFGLSYAKAMNLINTYGKDIDSKTKNKVIGIFVGIIAVLILKTKIISKIKKRYNLN